jgi:cobalt/nickel transport protein
MFKKERNQMKKVFALLLAVAFMALSVPVYAHFQMIYSPESVPTSRKLNLKLIFTHPFEAGHTMDIGKDENGKIHPPVAFGSVHRGRKTDLLNTLNPITFTSVTNSGRNTTIPGVRSRCPNRHEGDRIHR